LAVLSTSLGLQNGHTRIVVISREDQNTHLGEVNAHPARHLNAACFGHLDVENRNIWLQLLDECLCFLTIACFGYYFNIFALSVTDGCLHEQCGGHQPAARILFLVCSGRLRSSMIQLLIQRALK
jgi:hypothetical protein